MYEHGEGEPRRATEPARSGPPALLIAFVILAAVAIVFVVQNSEESKIEWLFFDATTPVWFVIAIAIVLGALLDRLLITWWRRRRRRDV